MSSLDDLRKGIEKVKAMERGEPVSEPRDYLDHVRESTRPDGAIDSATFDSKRTGRVNGGIACDVTSGPCRCGAWH